jgi:hypothetical protein
VDKDMAEFERQVAIDVGLGFGEDPNATMVSNIKTKYNNYTIS